MLKGASAVIRIFTAMRVESHMEPGFATVQPLVRSFLSMPLRLTAVRIPGLTFSCLTS